MPVFRSPWLATASVSMVVSRSNGAASALQRPGNQYPDEGAVARLQKFGLLHASKSASHEALSSFSLWFSAPLVLLGGKSFRPPNHAPYYYSRAWMLCLLEGDLARRRNRMCKPERGI